MATLEPAFTVSAEHPDEPVVVVFASNEFFVPYLATLIESLLANRSADRRYDLIVLSMDMSEHSVRQLTERAEADGASLRLLDVSEAMEPYRDKLRVRGHFKIETYFRLLLPQLLPRYEKVLYLDADMVCLRDVADAFDTDVTGYLVGACKDPDTAGLYNGADVAVDQEDKRGYMDDILKIEHPYDYFQAGTILFNLDEWRKAIDVDEVFRFAQAYPWQLLDQDVLNYFCQGHVRFLDMAWNTMYDYDDIRIANTVSCAPAELQEAYRVAREDPAIVHYAGPTKPWYEPSCDFAEHFWRYARKTPYYEVILHRMNARDLRHDHVAWEAIEDTRKWLQDVDDYVHAIDEYLKAVDTELLRYEHRSAPLMAKEFIYQKIMTPVADKALGNGALRKRVHGLYRKIKPSKQDGADQE